MHLRSGDEIHHQLMFIQQREDGGQKTMRYRLSIGMDVDDHDMVFYSDSSRTTIDAVELILDVIEVFLLL